MNYCIAVFTSRHATFYFANLLRSKGIPVAVINTPSSISRVCGISVKFLMDFFCVAKKLVVGAGFAGFYSYSSMNGEIKKI